MFVYTTAVSLIMAWPFLAERKKNCDLTICDCSRNVISCWLEQEQAKRAPVESTSYLKQDLASFDNIKSSLLFTRVQSWYPQVGHWFWCRIHHDPGHDLHPSWWSCCGEMARRRGGWVFSNNNSFPWPLVIFSNPWQIRQHVLCNDTSHMYFP